MKTMMIRFFSALAFVALGLYAAPAFALPEPWGLGFQGEASPSAERIHHFHHMLLYIITAITIFVFALLVWVVVRYNKRANPTPQQFSHNVLIEVIWTVVPVLILLAIAIPSFRLLYYVDRTETPDMTLKVIGHQWNWSYEYPNHGDISILSVMIPEKEIDKSKGQLRLLSTDNPVVLPVDTNIQILVTSTDVIHAFAVPELGVKIDAMPGHTNETWVRITKPGTYYGQCSELCGKDHAYMPIEVKAVSKEEFEAWTKTQK